jgi:hypothetical protein
MPGPPAAASPVPGPPASSQPADVSAEVEPDQDAGQFEPETADDDPSPEYSGTQASSGGTGDDRVDAALRRLDSIDELPIGEHVEQYDAVHRTLQDALAAIDEG